MEKSRTGTDAPAARDKVQDVPIQQDDEEEGQEALRDKPPAVRQHWPGAGIAGAMTKRSYIS